MNIQQHSPLTHKLICINQISLCSSSIPQSTTTNIISNTQSASFHHNVTYIACQSSYYDRTDM